MFRYLAASLVLALSCVSGAQAASWYMFNNHYTDTSFFYFDHDTVTKQGSTVTIWVKSVNDQNFPNSDGSLSAAIKDSYDCAKRTVRTLTATTYGKNAQFIRTNSNPGKAEDVIPGSIGEGLLKTVCAPDFPKNKSGDFYFGPIVNNNIFEHAAAYSEYLRAKKANPALK